MAATPRAAVPAEHSDGDVLLAAVPLPPTPTPTLLPPEVPAGNNDVVVQVAAPFTLAEAELPSALTLPPPLTVNVWLTKSGNPAGLIVIPELTVRFTNAHSRLAV